MSRYTIGWVLARLLEQIAKERGRPGEADAVARLERGDGTAQDVLRAFLLFQSRGHSDYANDLVRGCFLLDLDLSNLEAVEDEQSALRETTAALWRSVIEQRQREDAEKWKRLIETGERAARLVLGQPDEAIELVNAAADLEYELTGSCAGCDWFCRLVGLTDEDLERARFLKPTGK